MNLKPRTIIQNGASVICSPIGFVLVTLTELLVYFIFFQYNKLKCITFAAYFQEHQKARGGGTVCQKSKAISESYRLLVNGFEPCKV